MPDVLLIQRGDKGFVTEVCSKPLLNRLQCKYPHLFSFKTIRGRQCRQLGPVIKGFLGPAKGWLRQSDLSTLCLVDEDQV